MIYNWLESLTPQFRTKVKLLLKEAKFVWLDVFVFESYRSQNRQYELFWYWRTATLLKKYWVPVKYAKPNQKVRTWTLQSKHTQWQAVDLVFNKSQDPKKRIPTWSWDYKKLIEIWKKYWLRNLAPYEMAHFEDNGIPFFTEKKLKNMRLLIKVLWWFFDRSKFPRLQNMYRNLANEIRNTYWLEK